MHIGFSRELAKGMDEGHPNIIAREWADYLIGRAEYYMAIERDFIGSLPKYRFIFIQRPQIVDNIIVAGDRGEVGSIVLKL